jgi:hypothetical protein
MVRPSAPAVVRLMTNSNRVGRIAGKSPLTGPQIKFPSDGNAERAAMWPASVAALALRPSPRRSALAGRASIGRWKLLKLEQKPRLRL